MALRFLAFLATASASKVSVQLFAEAGCPFCRAAIGGPVRKTLEQLGDITERPEGSF